IAALRVRLDEAQHHCQEQAASGSSGEQGEEAKATLVLKEKVGAGAWHNKSLDETLRQVSGDAARAPLPPKLTARGARLLNRGRELLQQLKEMLEDPLLTVDAHDPLTLLHVDIASMLDVLLRTVQA